MGSLVEILHKRCPVLYMLSSEQTVADAVVAMTEGQVGAVPVFEDDALVGIFSERDLLRRVVARNRSPEKTQLGDVMTRDPVTAVAEEDRRMAIRKMQAVGCRHLPILAQGSVIDMLSMRDLLFVEIAERTAEVDQLRQYITGSY